MFFKSTLFTTASLLTLTSAHFRVTYPPDRGSSSNNQGTAPCGGLSPSSTRTEWPLDGGRIQFEPGHDEAHTEVRLYVGENPTKDEDFDTVLVPLFNQIGLGTFCWDHVRVPNGTAGVKDGAKATLVVRQAGHSSGWLYNCADIVFSSSTPELTSQCQNNTGIDAEPIPGNDNDSGSDDSGSEDGGNAASSTTVGGGLVGAGVLAVAALVGLF